MKSLDGLDKIMFFYHRTIGIIGAGIVGAGIAHVSIDKDFQVMLYDRTLSALNQGKSQIIKGYRNYVKRSRITKYEKKLA